MTPVIRQLNQENVDAVYELGIRESAFCFDRNQIGFWSKEQLSAWFNSPADICLGAFVADKLVGFALVAVHSPTKKATWENFFVKPEARGGGIGQYLEQALRQRLKQKGVLYSHFLVSHGNIHALRYFRDRDYKECGLFSWFSF